MEQAKILHIEDSPEVCRCVEDILAVRGVHRVVAWAESIAQAQLRLAEIKNNELDANIVLLDAHLKGGAFMNHPKIVVELIKQLELDLQVVGLSSEGLAERDVTLGRHVKADLLKSQVSRDPKLLDRILNALPETSA